jgi:alpha-beta hydrolase superfamily lysophospholipase
MPIVPSVEPHPVSDGTVLQVSRFRPEGPARASLVALHGIQSHAGWYRRSSIRLADAGYDVRWLDRRGSGQSGGARGHAPHWERLVQDVVSVLSAIRAEQARTNPPVPVILLAVSWGARLAATVARLRPELLDGLALLYPGIFSRFAPSLFQRLKLRLATALGIRNRPVLIPLDDPALFTGDPAAQAFIREDPLALRAATSGFFIADRELTRQAESAASHLKGRMLVMLAGRDRICDVAATRRYFRRIASPEKRLVEFPDATHTLEFDPCFDQFTAELIAWLDETCGWFAQREAPGRQPRGAGDPFQASTGSG